MIRGSTAGSDDTAGSGGVAGAAQARQPGLYGQGTRRM